MESVLEGFAEYYSAELSEKVIRGLTENALKAKANGGYPCLGLKVNEERCYVIDPLTAPYVQAVFQLYADGGTIKQARDYLNEKGVKNHRKKEFTYTNVSNMLKSTMVRAMVKEKESSTPLQKYLWKKTPSAKWKAFRLKALTQQNVILSQNWKQAPVL